jgi:hypothetical protein
LSAMTVKTDRKDARGLAQLLRMGWFQRVHADRPAGDAPSRVTNDPALTGRGARAKSDVADPRRHDHRAADATHVKPMTASSRSLRSRLITARSYPGLRRQCRQFARQSVEHTPYKSVTQFVRYFSWAYEPVSQQHRDPVHE